MSIIHAASAKINARRGFGHGAKLVLAAFANFSDTPVHGTFTVKGAALLLATRPVFIAAMAAVVLGGVTPAPAQVSDHERLRRAVDYLLASQLPSGLFRYDFDFLADRPVEGDDIVRQAGVGYILAEYYLHARDRRVRLAIEATLKTLAGLSLPIGKSSMQSALEQARLLSLPIGRYKLRAGLDRMGLLYQPRGDGKVISPDGKYPSAYTGATAVALLAELQYYQATTDNRFGELRSAWLKGLMHMRIPGRGFRIAPSSIDDTPFFDGEAWLALAHYDELFPSDQRVAALLRSLEAYLMTRYASEVSTGFYQWGTMAAARRFTVTSDPRYLIFIRTQAQTFLGARRRDPWRGDNSCAEMEGLATAARVLRTRNDPDRALRERLQARIGEEMENNRRLQIPLDAEHVCRRCLRVLAPAARVLGRFPGGTIPAPYTHRSHPALRVRADQARAVREAEGVMGEALRRGLS